MYSNLVGLLIGICFISTVSDASESTSLPDFNDNGTVDFGDFVILAGVFGSSQGDEKYHTSFDLNDDGEIGFSDFVIFAQDFGKEYLRLWSPSRTPTCWRRLNRHSENQVANRSPWPI